MRSRSDERFAKPCACGHDCLGGACEGSACRRIAIKRGLVGPRFLAVDDARVYWTSFYAGTVNAMDKGGGAVDVLASGDKGAAAIAVSADRVYWGNLWSNQLSSVKKDGTDQQPLGSPDTGGAHGMVIDGATLYWVTSNCDITAGVYAMPLPGGTATRLSTDKCGEDLALDAMRIYYTTAAGYLRRIPKTGVPGGGSPSPWIYSANAPSRVATSSGRVYYTTAVDGKVHHVAATGTGVTDLGVGSRRQRRSRWTAIRSISWRGRLATLSRLRTSWRTAQSGGSRADWRSHLTV